MATEIQIRTGDFEYINQKSDKEMTSEEAVEWYHDLKNAARSGDGLATPLFESFVQRQLEGEGNNIEEYNQMNHDQQAIVQMVKRLKKRIAYKITKNKE